MQQLELNVSIVKVNNVGWRLEALPVNNDDPSLKSYCYGDTYGQVLNGFYDALSNPYAKYWFLLQDY